jgi:hypothetical protein
MWVIESSAGRIRMKAYALKKIDGLDELDGRIVAQEIQALKGQIDAAGLKRKGRT